MNHRGRIGTPCQRNLPGKKSLTGFSRPFIVILISFQLGCGGQSYPGPPRGAVRGKITLDGEVVSHGSITFTPTTPPGAVSGGPIVAGEYQLSEEFGPTVGEQVVRFHWQKPTGKKIVDPDTGEEVEETTEGIPDKYQQLSKEKVTVKRGSQELNFDLKSN